jgi:hypothetical protein
MNVYFEREKEILKKKKCIGERSFIIFYMFGE